MNEGKRLSHREGADPTLIFFKGTYYAFVSMSAGFWHSKDLLNWEFHPAPNLLIYDYAPDVRQVGDYLYFCASRRNANCPILRTRAPLSEEFEEVSAPFAFWDPDLFQDDDGRVYLYWGCTNTQPIWGIEMDPETMEPIGEKVPLIYGREKELGYERPGDNGVSNKENSVVYQHLKHMFNPETGKIEFPAGMESMGGYRAEAMTAMFLSIDKPYMWATARLVPLHCKRAIPIPASPAVLSLERDMAAPLRMPTAISGMPPPCGSAETMILNAASACSPQALIKMA